MMLSYIEAFVKQLTAERQVSPHTVSNYQRDIKAFFHWFSSAEIEEMNRRSIQLYVAFLSRHKKAPTTIARHLSALRQYFNFLIEHKAISDNPAEGIKAPKKPQRLPKALPVDDVNNLLDNTENFFDLSNPQDMRNYAILELLYSSGIRVAELASLDIDDIDFSEAKATVIGKGNKQREVFLGAKAIAALRQWLSVRSIFINDNNNTEEIPQTSEPALFLNRYGKRISIRGIQYQIKAIGKRFNINLDLHPHQMRHSFGSHLLQSGVDLRSVQELLGHSDISSTQIYTQLDFQHLAQVYDKAHPRAKKKR